jgi:hypothetical protein
MIAAMNSHALAGVPEATLLRLPIQLALTQDYTAQSSRATTGK